MDRQPRHLHQMAHRRFAGIGLPVGVGDEADRRVEGEIGRDCGEAARVEGQKALQPLQGVEQHEAGGAESQHRKRILQPGLFLVPVDTCEEIEPAFQRGDQWRQERRFAIQDPGHVEAERPRGGEYGGEHGQDLGPSCEGHGRSPNWRALKAFGIEQGVDEVDGEADGHHQSDQRFTHVRLLEPGTAESVERQQRQAAEPQAEKSDVEHGNHPPEQMLSVRCGGRHKFAMWNLGRGHQGGIRIGPDDAAALCAYTEKRA